MDNIRKYLLSLFLSITPILAGAQNWSYVYIQGDKEIPFYVKLEGEMLPRYSKNYCIIPQLEAGPINLQILFQQNEYPAQNFKVLVPEKGHRGFLLTRQDNTFALYDIEQRFYLFPGELGEDHLPEMIAITPPQTKQTSKESSAQQVKTKPAKTNPEEEKNSSEPQFIEDLVLDNEHAVQMPANNPSEEAPQQQSETTESYNIAQEPALEENTNYTAISPATETVNILSHTSPILNSDCPEPVSDAAFDKLYNTTKEKKDEEKRVAYLMKIAENNCLSSRQAYFLARELSAESMRYSFLKKVYSKITDQHNFSMLEDYLFNTLEWKSYFRLIYQ